MGLVQRRGQARDGPGLAAATWAAHRPPWLRDHVAGGAGSRNGDGMGVRFVCGGGREAQPEREGAGHRAAS